MRSIIFLVVCGCVGCVATIPRVEVVQPLPTYHSNDHSVLPQKHYITPDDLLQQTYNLNLQYQTLAQQIDNYRWFYYPTSFATLSQLMHKAIDRMNMAKNVEEYIFYHRLYMRCKGMVDEFEEFRQNEEWKMKEIIVDMERGVE